MLESVEALTKCRPSNCCTWSINLETFHNNFCLFLFNRAEAEAEGIFNEYVVEAETYARIIQEQNLTVEGFLAYMGVRTVGLAHNPVYAGIDAPAKTAYLGP